MGGTSFFFSFLFWFFGFVSVLREGRGGEGGCGEVV